MEVIERQLKEFEKINDLLDKEEIFSSERLFKCILGLNKTESKVFGYILKNENASTSEIASKLKMERSSIQRALQSLSKLLLINRESLSMKDYGTVEKNTDSKKQGYLYVYNSKDLDSIKAQFKKLLDKWYSSMVNYIDNLENLCECCGFKFDPC
ncbi:MAG: helix-turn-helix domain-containing protein [Candidatus Thorarchaeota archaeon]